MKIVPLDEQLFDTYSKEHPLTSYYQTSSYGHLMSNHGFKYMILGFYEGMDLLGASLILYKPSFVGFKYGYAPRGLLIDYSNYNKVLEISKELKNYLFKERFILLKIDPLILFNKKDKNGNILETNNSKEQIISNLQKADFNHCGFNNYFESIKPRFHSILELTNEEELFNDFNKTVRNKIRKADKFGIKIHKDNNALETIYPFIKDKTNYSLNYYKNLKNCFNDSMEIYVAKLDTEEYVENSRLFYEKEAEYNEYLNNIISRDGYKGKDMKDILNKKMESDKLLVIYKDYLVKSIETLKEHPDGIIIGGSIIIKHNDTINLIVDGYDKDYRNLCSNYLLRFEIIKEYCNTEYKYIDLNAIVGVFEKEQNKYYQLNQNKFGFSKVANEYIGEFNLIINNPMYALYRSLVLEDSLKDIEK